MRIDIPQGLIDFAQEFSSYKTPARRTQGWEEQSHEVRGMGDFTDTVGTLMLWRFLAQSGIHCTYFLTANGGDDTDIRIIQNQKTLDINVKTSVWQPDNDNVFPKRGHIAVKALEFQKPLPKLYAQVIVHNNEHDGEPHIHLCNFIPVESDQFKKHASKKDTTVIPNAGGTKGLWIPSEDAAPITLLPKWVNKQ